MASIASVLRRTLLIALTTTTIQQGVTAQATTHKLPGQLTGFGERPSYSPDGKRIAFMGKSFGDAFEVDLETRDIKLLTEAPNAGFLRVQFLPNGDYFLIGARTFKDIVSTREADEEMWILKPGQREPIALNHKIWEGVAISYQQNRISWTNTHANYPDEIAENVSIVYVADIVYDDDGTPSLANKTEIFRTDGPACSPEPQDFRKNDTELVYTCYTDTDHPTGGDASGGIVQGIDLETGEVTIYRDVVGEYNEVEGIFPGGDYTLVESTRENWKPNNGTRPIDLWRLNLQEPNSTDFVRLTYFGDVHGAKAGNPVVSPDGRSIAFAEGRLSDAAGVGRGILVLSLDDFDY
ncbi:hypothetical protein F4821DRAFT_245155 [Hypoxylon rubiginosum]|uniref:Uncharacterized protein n=1 Tax=Hypoxylon rubiginosum TaxID=110542 RepID=A0ACC0CS63_9PEZI|nr:hypothetical protein F4821DRAFT_245155 [Hypoxylon rubiginosum]